LSEVSLRTFVTSPMTTWLRRRLIELLPLALLIGVALNAQSVALTAIHLYQRALSPVAARAGLSCRFTPTCSRFAEVVIEREGVVGGRDAGGYLTTCAAATCGRDDRDRTDAERQRRQTDQRRQQSPNDEEHA